LHARVVSQRGFSVQFRVPASKKLSFADAKQVNFMAESVNLTGVIVIQTRLGFSELNFSRAQANGHRVVVLWVQPRKRPRAAAWRESLSINNPDRATNFGVPLAVVI
jgi:hypothetical protein